MPVMLNLLLKPVCPSKDLYRSEFYRDLRLKQGKWSFVEQGLGHHPVRTGERKNGRRHKGPVYV